MVGGTVQDCALSSAVFHTLFNNRSRKPQASSSVSKSLSGESRHHSEWCSLAMVMNSSRERFAPLCCGR